ncbi:MAG: hypothetical protein HY716_11215 [Planctomycetes bacterium]|nr:hypothetical protein [Planctomycetota bacterium]
MFALVFLFFSFPSLRSADLLQEVSLAALKRADRYKEGTNFRAWVREIAFHRILRWARRLPIHR